MREAYYSEPPSYLDRPATPWEEELVAALQAIFTSGTHDLAGIVMALNRSSVKPPDGETWTADRFQAVLRKVGS